MNMREKPDKENREVESRSLTAEEKVEALLKSGGEIVKCNHWLPEQCFLTEIKLGDETHRFKTELPLPIIKTDSPPPDAEKINPSSTEES